jgi:hypothetical protein
VAAATITALLFLTENPPYPELSAHPKYGAFTLHSNGT